MTNSALTSERRAFGIATTGGPTAVIDVGGVRIVTDPTFDQPRTYSALKKVQGPATPMADLGAVDVVLISHDDHDDNLDQGGRELARRAGLVLTTRSAAARIEANAVGLAPWDEYQLPGGVLITAVPANHGPADGERTAAGFINCEVIGFVITAPNGLIIYVSGDNASLRLATEIHEHFPRIDYAILHAGAASVSGKFGGRPLSLTGARTAAAAEILNAGVAIAVHLDGWAHFTEGFAEVEAGFAAAGVGSVLDSTPHGAWRDTIQHRGTAWTAEQPGGSRRTVHAEEAPAAIGPYAHAAGTTRTNLIHLSGQTPIDPATGQLVDGDITAQTKQVFRNLETVLAAAKARWDDVVKVNVYLVSMADFPAMNAVYADTFTSPYPARTTVAVSELPLGARVEIELVAGRS